MRNMKLWTRTVVALSALVLVAVGSSTAALVCAWRVRAADRLAAHDVHAMVVSSDLWSSLRQDYVAMGYFVEDGSAQRAEEASRASATFQDRLTEREEAAESIEEKAVIPRLQQISERYEAKRREIYALRAAGNDAAAKDAYLGEMAPLYREGTTAIAELIAIDEREVDTALAAGHVEILRLSAFVTAGAVLTSLLGVGVAWLLFRQVFRPLSEIAADCRSCLANDGRALEAEGEKPKGDLTVLGYYLQTLMAEVVATRSDLEKKRARLEQSQRLETIGNMVACISHEIKNALTCIGGFARFIEKKPDNAERVRQEAGTILKISRQLEHMVRETMDYSRPVRVEPQVQSLNALVSDALAPLAAEVSEDVVLEVNLDPAVPKVACDAGYMEQVVTNLVGNAVEAVNGRGHIQVETRPYGDGAMLVVRDDGPGIPPEIQSRLFEPFFTTKKKGNGLGLPICRQIVTSHGGSIVFRSAPGEGTTFEVKLPAAREGVPAQIPPGGINRLARLRGQAD